MLTLKGTRRESRRKTGERRIAATFRISKALILPLEWWCGWEKAGGGRKNRLENKLRMEPWER